MLVAGVLGTEDWLDHELFSSSSKRSRNFDAFCAALEAELAKKGRCVECRTSSSCSVLLADENCDSHWSVLGCSIPNAVLGLDLCVAGCRDDWIQIFLDAGIAVSKVNTIQEAIDDAQVCCRRTTCIRTY